jgi:hypothetical protein
MRKFSHDLYASNLGHHVLRREFGLAFHGGSMLSSDTHGVPVSPS